MRRCLAILAFAITGCCGVVGPFQRCGPPTRVADPCLPIPEQEQRAREKIALPQGSFEVGPRTYMEQPSYRGP
jgi:hypothetical protein